MENLIGKVGVFTSYEDEVWGSSYAGKEAKVIEVNEYEYSNSKAVELKIEFLHDGKKLSIDAEEFELI